MASDQKFIDFILEQIDGVGELKAKKMFGEYGLYADDKLFGLVCDNRLFIKPTVSGRAFVGEIVEEAPYKGAKPCFLIEEQLQDRRWLSELIKSSLPELAKPKKKK